MENKNIGGLWLKTGKGGAKFMSGSIEILGVKHKFIVFKNRYKTTEKHPDYIILPSNPLDNVKAEAEAEKDEDLESYINNGKNINFDSMK